VKDRQKQQFKNRVMQLYEESLLSNSLQSANNTKMFVFSSHEQKKERIESFVS
jgi:hypothetical protein